MKTVKAHGPGCARCTANDHMAKDAAAGLGTDKSDAWLVA